MNSGATIRTTGGSSAHHRAFAFLFATFAALAPAIAESPREPAPRYDLSKDRVLYCIGYAHLDTQWRWDFCQTIDQYIRDTLEGNFKLIEKYPEYVFNFTGSVRYEMMKEYYPEHFEKLKKYIAAGRWYVSGSSVDEGDVNVPSAEAIIRQVLYGNLYFRREFGKESVDFMLPDCFGFPASLPSIWAHCGLTGFSTQKLTWGSAVGIPFKVGVWEGPDGRGVIAALDPGPYVGAIEGPVHESTEWAERITTNGDKYGLWADYHYYGIGDMGGAPREEDVKNYTAAAKADGPFRVALVSSDRMYKDISPEIRAKLPRYKGDLLLTEHSAGTLTSQAYMKRWNRKGELLADAAERASVAADWLGGAVYPREKLERSWVRLLANQMHDILPGTSLPKAYTYSWNDEIVAMNGFAAALADGAGAVCRALDTRGDGQAVVVFNPLAQAREDLVEAKVRFAGGAPRAVRVLGPDGSEAPAQVLSRDGESVIVAFVAAVTPVSWTVYRVCPGGSLDATREKAGANSSARLNITENSLENPWYRVTINADGDVSSIVDKAQGGRELLAAPARLVFTHEKPKNWPAWNMDWRDRQKPPIDAVKSPAKVRIVEQGPARVALEIVREARGSIFTQQIRLCAGDAGRRVEFKTHIDWQSAQVALRASFPLTAANAKATYNWGMGTIDRANNEPTKYEVPSHEWFDLTDQSGKFGVSVLEDCKFGSDKPSDSEVRLTLLYTPGVRSGYLDQHSQDWGVHDMTYALYSHAGDWRAGRSEWQGRRLNQPLVAFTAPSHEGELGKSFSLLQVNTEQVDVRAVKRSEEGEWVIVRLQELWGREAKGVTVKFAGPIASAHEVDSQERRIGEAKVAGGALSLDMTPYSPRSFAVRLGPAPTQLMPPKCMPIRLEFDVDAVSGDSNRADGAMDSEGRTYPAEQLPATLVAEGIAFQIGSGAAGEKNAMACAGQEILLSGGGTNRLYLLVAASEDCVGEFDVDGRKTKISIQGWTGFVGQFDDRVWDRPFNAVDFVCEGRVTGLTPGYIHRDPIAWFATHRHHPTRGNEAYQFSYMYKYRLDVPLGAKVLKLPKDERIKVFAVTEAANENDAAQPAVPLYDDFSDRGPIEFRYRYPPPVDEGQDPIARVMSERADSFAALKLPQPSKEDYADASRGKVTFRYFGGDGEFAPHRQSGAEGNTLPRLNDGEVPQNNDDTKRNVWYDSEGRFHVDLGASVKLRAVRSYSWHRDRRAPQVYTLWGSNDPTMPDAGFTSARDTKWKLLARVDTTKLGDGGVHAVEIAAGPTTQTGDEADGGDDANEANRDSAVIGAYRYLLFITPSQGTFFSEVDVDVAE